MDEFQPSRAYQLIRRHGKLRIAILAACLLAMSTTLLALIGHQFAGEAMRLVDYANCALIPFVLGTPALYAGASLVERLEQVGAELLHLSRHDASTGAYNRRYLIEWADAMCQQARADGGAVALILIDADLFKLINDRYGHPAGDAVLRRLVRIIHALIEPGEVYGRYGGEEFAIFLPDRTLEQAGERAEQIRRAFAVGEVNFRGEIIKATLRAGVACCSGAEATVGRLVARAEAALYGATHGGRDRTELAIGS